LRTRTLLRAGAFDEPDVTHVEGDVDPVRDLQIISDELRIKDLQYIAAPIDKMEKVVKRGGQDKQMKEEYVRICSIVQCIDMNMQEVLCKVRDLLDDGKHVRFQAWNEKEIEVLNKHLFLTSKPIVYLVNLSKEDYLKKKNKW
jgi:obg-like ATPase 1